MKKIVIIGPESTGKSTLCEKLAAHFNMLWCPEYAREYLLENGIKYSYEDLLTIARGQVQLEERYIQLTEEREEKLLFIDTDMYVMKVWCEFVFGKCHSFITDTIAKRKYDLYLLCNIDLPWVPDELREYPDEAPRKELYSIYKNILLNQRTAWVEISGDYEERLIKAVRAVEKYCLPDQ